MKKTLIDTLGIVLVIAGFTFMVHTLIEELPPAPCESLEEGC